jgi:hypothetical protein
MGQHREDRPLSRQKVFGIGFHKTGTTSLAAALEQLGYRVTGPNGVHDPDIADNVHDMAQRLLTEHDAVQDNPWPLLFRELDAWYPGARFVLTRRDPGRWMASVTRHFGAEDTPMRAWIYGVGHPEGNEEIYLARFQRHYAEVEEHFRDRPGDLLSMDLTAGDGWETLCPFLGVDVPSVPFPHRNRASQRARRRGLKGLFRRRGT